MRRFATATASASSATATSTDAVRRLDGDRPDRVGLEAAQAAALDHRRTAHPERRGLGGDDQVGAAGEDRVAGEAAPGDDRDPRHDAREPAPEREGAGVERRDDGVVGVAGAPAATLGEEHRRQAHPLDQLEQPVLLAMADRPLGPGEHRVVVGEHRAGGALAEQLAVDPRGAGDQPVGRGAGDQLVRRRGASAARRSRARRTRRSCPRRRDRRGSRARCGRRPHGGARPPRAAPRRRSGGGARAPRRGRRGRVFPRGEASHTLAAMGLALRNAIARRSTGRAALRGRRDQRARAGGRARSQGDEADRRRRDGARARARQRPHARGDDPVSRLRRRPAADGVARRGTSGRSRSGWTTTTSTGARGLPASR